MVIELLPRVEIWLPILCSSNVLLNREQSAITLLLRTLNVLHQVDLIIHYSINIITSVSWFCTVYFLLWHVPMTLGSFMASVNETWKIDDKYEWDLTWTWFTTASQHFHLFKKNRPTLSSVQIRLRPGIKVEKNVSRTILLTVKRKPDPARFSSRLLNSPVPLLKKSALIKFNHPQLKNERGAVEKNEGKHTRTLSPWL